MKHSAGIILFFLSFLFSGEFKGCAQEQAPAFPGAEGAGKFTGGGRGGEVFMVTNLNDRGPGSFRAAVDEKGRRTIVFMVSGTISLESPIIIENGDLTIAGQTAPGDGICLKDYPLTFEDGNVIIRYMRFRLGDSAHEPFDAINCKNQENIIIDHCSMSWSVDETGSFYDNRNFTLQWCMITESLNNSVHRKGRHGYGGIWGGMNATFHHNLLAHHASRNPRFQGSRYHKKPDLEKTDFINNVIYNWGFKSSYGGEQGHYNMINNYYKPGPATKNSQRTVILEPFRPLGWFYLSGNVVEGSEEVTNDNWKGVELPASGIDSVKMDQAAFISPEIKMESALVAYNSVLESAGASLHRDEVDKRIISEVREGTAHCGENGIIDSQNDAGGWPELKSIPAPADKDLDGMPDSWEIEKKLNPDNGADGKEYKLDENYTNLEVYLNEIILTTAKTKY